MKKISLVLVLFAALLTVGVVRAQQPPAVPPKVDETPVLTEVQSLRLQVAYLKAQLDSTGLALEVCGIERDHPGYKYDLQKGLVKK